jgi:hypothetical protein
VIRVPTEVGQALRTFLHGGLAELETTLGVRLVVQIDARLPRSQCEVQVVGRRPPLDAPQVDAAPATAATGTDAPAPAPRES